MTWSEVTCWVFDVVPSKLRPVLFSNSMADIQFKTKMRVSYQQVLISQEHQVLANIMRRILGGGSSSTSKVPTPIGAPQADNVYAPKTADELKMAFSKVFR
jgi:hypothetical protein